MLCQIGQEMVLLAQRQVVHHAAVVLRVRAKHRVAGHGHENDVAGIDQRRRKNRKRRLAADGVDDLRLRIDGHAADPAQIPRRRLLEHGVAIVGVPAVLRLAGLRVKRLDDPRVGHRVGLAHAEIEKFRVRVRLLRGALGPLDLLELIDGGVFAVTLPADPLGEQILNVAFLHNYQL